MGFLVDLSRDLTNFRDDLKATSDERIANAQSKALNIVGKKNAASFKRNFDKFRQQLDPRVNGRTPFIELGGEYLRLQSMDTYKVRTTAKFLTPMLATKDPILPMIFNVVFPDVAFAQNRVTPLEPLFLFVNPRTWSRSTSKKQVNTYTRSGYISERWGEQLEQISASGNIGAFFTKETGLTRFSRNQTPSYINLMELVQVYKNNATIYDKSYPFGLDISVKTQDVRPTDVGFVEILYGLELFRGTFDSFSIRESADKPYTLEYNFTFNVSEVISVHDVSSSSSDIDIELDQTAAGIKPILGFSTPDDLNRAFIDSQRKKSKDGEDKINTPLKEDSTEFNGRKIKLIA